MTYCLDDLFEKFVRERIYLQNVSSKTAYFYNRAWKALRKSFKGDELTQDVLTELLVLLRQSGVKPVSINIYSRPLNAFLNWAFKNEHIRQKLTIPKLKEDKPVLKTVNDSYLRSIIKFKPKTFAQTRLWVLLQLLMDTGMRINEALTLEKDRIDLIIA